MRSFERRFGPELVAFASGLIVWIAISTYTHNPEAWDAPVYLVLGIPTLALITGILAFFFPAHPIRLGVLPMCAQALWLCATVPMGQFGPFGLIFFGVFSVPCILTAFAGAWMGQARRHHALER